METPIASYTATRELLRTYDLRVKKHLGQNFLTDHFVLNKIIAAADVALTDLVIEIGPGLGALTQALLPLAGRLVAVELDIDLAQALGQTLAGYQNLIILNRDALHCDWAAIAQDLGYSSFKAVANLPYYITTPLIMSLLEGGAPLTSLTVMIQKEVAARILAKPATQDYGALTLGVAYRAKASLVANVPRNCFVPRPNVDSAVIHLDIYQTPPVQVSDQALLFSIIKAAFSQRRKTLVNCINNANTLSLTKEAVEHALTSCNLPKDIRGETLSLSQFAKITNALIFQRS